MSENNNKITSTEQSDWAIFFKKAEAERLRSLNLFIKNFWEQEVLGGEEFGLSNDEFCQLDNERKLELMSQGFKRKIDELVVALNLPTLSKDEFDQFTSEKFSIFLEKIINDNRFERFFPRETIDRLKNQIRSLDYLSEPERTTLKQKTYLEIVNRCSKITNSSVFSDLPPQAIKNKSGNCLILSSLLANIGKKAGIDCQIAEVVGHFVTVAKTSDGKYLMFDSYRPENIGVLVEGENIEGLPTLMPDPQAKENENIPFHIYFTGIPELLISGIFNNVKYCLDPSNFNRRISYSINQKEDEKFRDLLIQKYGQNLSENLKQALDYLCPHEVKATSSKKFIDEKEKVNHNTKQNWENVFSAREERAKDKSRQNHPDFVRYREWLIDQVKDKLSSYQRRDGKTYYDLTLLFCPPPFLENLLSLLGDSITHVNIVDFSKTAIESIREVLEKLRSEPNRRLGNSLISIPDDIKELFSNFYDEEYEIGKGNTIILSADFFSPDLWKEMIQIFLEKEEAKTLIFEVLENSETGDWKSYLHPQSYRYFVYSKEYVETMFSQLGVQNFQITPSPMITSPTGYSFRTLLITIKKE